MYEASGPSIHPAHTSERRERTHVHTHVHHRTQEIHQKIKQLKSLDIGHTSL